MLGRLTIDALPFYSWIAFGGALVTVGGALAVVAGITWFGLWRYLWNEWLTSVDHKRIGIMYVTLAMIMLMRGFVDAMMMRSQQAIALNSDGYLPPEHFDQIFSSARHHHDLLHGDAVSDRTDQYRGSAADRRARRRLPVHELGEPLAHHGRRRAGHGVAGDRQVLDRGLDRIPAVLRLGIQPGRRGRLLAVGDPDQRHRLDADRHQFHRDHHQAARARHDVHAHAAVHLDRPVLQRPDDLRLSRPDRGVRDAGARPHARHALFHQRRRRQHDELPQPVLAVGSSGSLHPDPAGLRGLFGGGRDVLRQAAVRLHLAGPMPRRRSRSCRSRCGCTISSPWARAPTSMPSSAWRP